MLNIKLYKKLTPTELAYMAGFFDGEGSVTIHINGRYFSPRGVTPNHTLQVSIGNTDSRVLEWIYKILGGSLLCRRIVSPKHRPVTQWIIRTKAALIFLKAIRPYVRMKKDQVDVAIKYQESKTMMGPKRVSKQDVTWRELQRATIRQLNTRSWTPR